MIAFMLQHSNTANSLFCKVKQQHYIGEVDSRQLCIITMLAKDNNDASESVKIM